MSSQLVTIPCSMGYFRVKIPLLDCASSPTYESFCPIPTITLMSWPSNDGGEDSSWSVITGKPCFAHSRAIVNHQSCNFVVTHFCFKFYICSKDRKNV